MRILNESWPKARRTHQCVSCLRTILPGETYTRQVQTGHDGIVAFKICAHCWRVLAWILLCDCEAFDGDYGVDVGEYLQECALAVPELKRSFLRRWDGVTVDVVDVLLALLPIPYSP